MTMNSDEKFSAGIRERYLDILAQITKASIRAGNPQARLVVVSKSQPIEVVQAAIAAGIPTLGENYAEEAVEKIKATGQTGVEWHMIGHVQSRKAKLVAEHFSMLHSLDSITLAGRLERCCADIGRILPVLLEVNVSGEESKFGFPAWDEHRWADLLPTFESMEQFQHLQVCGLMTMPPYNEDSEKTRPYFKRMRRLQEYLNERNPRTDWSGLSMGTSVDYLPAVEEGATYVRVGEAILGARKSREEVG
jgi:PLP dependent protein